MILIHLKDESGRPKASEACKVGGGRRVSSEGVKRVVERGLPFGGIRVWDGQVRIVLKEGTGRVG